VKNHYKKRDQIWNSSNSNQDDEDDCCKACKEQYSITEMQLDQMLSPWKVAA
jgi:hypothetical protein